jgi:hypothetical protein
MRSIVNMCLHAVVGAFILVAFNAVGNAQPWQTQAQWHRLLNKDVPGTLILDDQGVEFRSSKITHRWTYIEIHSFSLSTRELTLTSYQNRAWHEPGELSFRFNWTEPMPPEIAAQFAERVAKPVQNGVPLLGVASLAELPAHHKTWSGGSNGTLRLKDRGIDYVTKDGRDSRAWRWEDIQTIANPNPYELRVAAYRETFEFDLKQPLSRSVFEQLWDRLFNADLNLSAGGAGEHR